MISCAYFLNFQKMNSTHKLQFNRIKFNFLFCWIEFDWFFAKLNWIEQNFRAPRSPGVPMSGFVFFRCRFSKFPVEEDSSTLNPNSTARESRVWGLAFFSVAVKSGSGWREEEDDDDDDRSIATRAYIVSQPWWPTRESVSGNLLPSSSSAVSSLFGNFSWLKRVWVFSFFSFSSVFSLFWLLPEFCALSWAIIMFLYFCFPADVVCCGFFV
jgi:hypothetical protein